jgi:uncharacterized protein involved in outer membrane biogenesis
MPVWRRVLVVLAATLLLVLLIAGGTAYWFLSGDGVRLALERQASNWLGEPVRIESVRLGIVPIPAIHLANVQVGEPARLTLAAIDLRAPLRGLLRRQIEDAEIVVSRSRIEMPLPFARQPSSTTTATATTSTPLQLISIRSIALRDMTLVSRGRTIAVSGDAVLRGNQLTVTRLDASSGATRLHAEGIVALERRVDAQFRVRADRIDADELLALANAFSSPSTSRASNPTSRLPIRIAARVSAARGTAAGIDMSNLATDLQVDGSQVSLSPVSFQAFGGQYQGSLATTLGDTLAATLRSRVTNIDVAELAAFGGVPGSITGRLTGAATFSGRGADFAGVLRNVRGDGTATISNGTIEHLNLVRTVILFFGRPAPDQSPSSDRFDRLDARFSLADQVVRADALSLHSTDAEIVGDGTLSLETKALDGHADISLSEELSKQAGTDLYRYTREGSRVVLPATIGGRLGAPRLGIDATAAVKRGLRNEIQRRLGGLLDRFGNK